MPREREMRYRLLGLGTRILWLEPEGGDKQGGRKVGVWELRANEEWVSE